MHILPAKVNGISFYKWVLKAPGHVFVSIGIGLVCVGAPFRFHVCPQNAQSNTSFSKGGFTCLAGVGI